MKIAVEKQLSYKNAVSGLHFIINAQARRNWGIFAKVDLLPIDNDCDKKKTAKKYELVQIPPKLLVTLLLFTPCNA